MVYYGILRLRDLLNHRSIKVINPGLLATRWVFVRGFWSWGGGNRVQGALLTEFGLLLRLMRFPCLYLLVVQRLGKNLGLCMASRAQCGVLGMGQNSLASLPNSDPDI